MRKRFEYSKRKLQEYWRNMMQSTHKKISEGASQISRMMTCAHKDQWRHHDKKK